MGRLEELRQEHGIRGKGGVLEDLKHKLSPRDKVDEAFCPGATFPG